MLYIPPSTPGCEVTFTVPFAKAQIGALDKTVLVWSPVKGGKEHTRAKVHHKACSEKG